MFKKEKLNKFCILNLVVILLLICAINCFLINQDMAYAYVINDESDILFMQTLESIVSKENNGKEVNFNKEIVYDLQLQQLGYVYSFKIAETDGYAILINTEGGWSLTEFVLDAVSPYLNEKGKSIYISELLYGVCVNNTIKLIGLDKSFALNEIDDLLLKRYSAIGRDLQESSERVSYKLKSVDKYSMAIEIPHYISETLSNGCVPIAAANIVAFYDRTCENLIKNYAPGSGKGKSYKYKKQNEVIDNLINELAVQMQLDVTGLGCTIFQFKQGLTNYCKNCQYDVIYNSCMNNGTLDYDRIKTSLKSGVPAMLFVSQLQISEINDKDNYDEYHTYNGIIDHTMSIFGYREITYTQDDGYSKRNYLLVATGMQSVPQAYLNIDNNLITDEAFLISIV